MAVLRDRLDDDLRVVAEFDHASYAVLYAVPSVVEEYGGPDGLGARLRRLHLFLSMDYIEQRLFAELGFEFGDVGATVACTDHATFVRYYTGDEALLVTVDPAASGDAVVETPNEVPGGAG